MHDYQRARIDTIINLALEGRLPDLTNGDHAAWLRVAANAWLTRRTQEPQCMLSILSVNSDILFSTRVR